MRDLVPFVQVEAEDCNFTKRNTPPWVFSTFFKLYKWYQIAQSITCIFMFAPLKCTYIIYKELEALIVKWPLKWRYNTWGETRLLINIIRLVTNKIVTKWKTRLLSKIIKISTKPLARNWPSPCQLGYKSGYFLLNCSRLAQVKIWIRKRFSELLKYQQSNSYFIDLHLVN